MTGASAVLRRPVLVLNRAWLPIGITTVRTALSLLFTTYSDTGEPKSRYLDLCNLSVHCPVDLLRMPPTDLQDTIRTPKHVVRVPEAIVLSRFTGVPGSGEKHNRRPPRFSRGHMFARDGFQCGYCGTSARGNLTMDHVMPVSRGGRTHFENCVTACEACNLRKGARTPKEAGLKLRKGVRLITPTSETAANQRLAECAKLFKSLIERNER